MLLPIQTLFIESRVGIPKTASRKQPISHVQFAEKVGQSRKVYPAFKAGPLNNTKPLINPGPVQLGEKKQKNKNRHALSFPSAVLASKEMPGQVQTHPSPGYLP